MLLACSASIQLALHTLDQSIPPHSILARPLFDEFESTLKHLLQ
jgi:hypothetical protein